MSTRPTREAALNPNPNTDWIARAWDTLDDVLDRRAVDRIDRRAQETTRAHDRRWFDNERFRDTTDREDLERDDESARIRDRLKDKRDRYRLQTDREDLERDDDNARYRDITTRDDLERNDELAAYEATLDAEAALRDDERRLLVDRGELYQAAFESRRGDTLISRAMWPAALAAAALGAIYVIREWT